MWDFHARRTRRTRRDGKTLRTLHPLREGKWVETQSEPSTDVEWSSRSDVHIWIYFLAVIERRGQPDSEVSSSAPVHDVILIRSVFKTGFLLSRKRLVFLKSTGRFIWYSHLQESTEEWIYITLSKIPIIFKSTIFGYL